MKEPPDFLPEQSKEAIHAAKNAAQAIEIARLEQLELTVKANDERIVKLFQDSLMNVFGAPDKLSREEMHLLMPKIPLLCLTVEQQGKTMQEIKDDIKWATRLVIGAVITAAIGVILVR